MGIKMNKDLDKIIGKQCLLNGKKATIIHVEEVRNDYYKIVFKFPVFKEGIHVGYSHMTFPCVKFCFSDLSTEEFPEIELIFPED